MRRDYLIKNVEVNVFWTVEVNGIHYLYIVQVNVYFVLMLSFHIASFCAKHDFGPAYSLFLVLSNTWHPGPGPGSGT